MPTAAQAQALVELLDTRTPIVVVETLAANRWLALAEVAAREAIAALRTWAADRAVAADWA